ncbi:MAG: hypothetical protein LUE99_13685 [Bacteroides sp.]|nr:hypothetical protein [Bacteroides sp.]
MNSKLQESKVKQLFTRQEVITNTDILYLYRKEESAIPEATVNWRIYHLVQKGVIQRIGKGKYREGKARTFSLELSSKTIKAGKFVGKEFPYINYCVWELAAINSFSQHLINYNVTFLEVEREVIDSVYRALKDVKYKVVRIKDITEDLSEYAGYVCVRALVTEAPVLKEKNGQVASLEKILVDLYCDKEFSPFQGNEIYHIYKNAFNDYTVNESTMLRYASRKEKKAEIEEVINSIKRQ